MSQVEAGGCLCGEVRYSFPRDAVISSFHCHCTDCQKSTGCGKASLVMVPTAAIATEGELKGYTVTGTEGATVSRGFCSNCGSPVMSQVAEMPDIRMIKVGSLEDSSWVSPVFSCWTSSAQTWSPADASLPTMENNPEL